MTWLKLVNNTSVNEKNVINDKYMKIIFLLEQYRGDLNTGHLEYSILGVLYSDAQYPCTALILGTFELQANNLLQDFVPTKKCLILNNMFMETCKIHCDFETSFFIK